jgi:hypothetical protein
MVADLTLNKSSPYRGGGAREARDGGVPTAHVRLLRHVPLHHPADGPPPRAWEEFYG